MRWSGVTQRIKSIGAVIAAAMVATTIVARVFAQASGDPEVLQLRPNVYLIGGAGSNVVFQVGEDGTIVVDAGSAAGGASVVAAIKKTTKAPIRYVINTSADTDHVGGNETVSKAGETLLGDRGFAALAVTGSSIMAAEKVLTRMSAPTGRAAPFPFTAWPTETFDYGLKSIYLNGEGIEIRQQPAAHSDGDSIVFFRRSDVIVAGDIIDATRFPVIDVARGGSVQGELDALNRLIAMAIPSTPIVSREAGTLVVPGHGRVYDQFDVLHYRDMVTIIRDHVQDLIKAGKTLDQIKAAGPARGYSGRYGSDSGSWTTNDFVEAIYRSLVAAKS
jgi:glyoxylase-like metal-dependent hydrolase (beta-lactamase superfamily II)